MVFPGKGFNVFTVMIDDSVAVQLESPLDPIFDFSDIQGIFNDVTVGPLHHDLGSTVDPRGDNGHAGCHGFQARIAEGFVDRRE